jgi:hypothetical protein
MIASAAVGCKRLLAGRERKVFGPPEERRSQYACDETDKRVHAREHGERIEAPLCKCQ